jgi:hypothetical protein
MSGTISATTAALIAAAVGAAGVGTGLYESVASRDAQSDAQKAQQQALLKQQQQQAVQADLTKREAVLGAQGQAQQQTGGSLTDQGTAALTDLLAGYPGYQAGTSGTGGGTGTSTGQGVGQSGIPGQSGAGSPSGPPDIAAILAALRNQGGASPFGGPGGPSPSSLSGGNWSTPSPTPSTRFELANPPV